VVPMTGLVTVTDFQATAVCVAKQKVYGIHCGIQMTHRQKHN
jgi:hypothetical protein